MSHRQSSRGSLPGKLPPFNGSSGKAAGLDLDVDLELDIDWEGLGFGEPSLPRPVPVPASERKPASGCESAPISRIGEKKQNAKPKPALPRSGKTQSEEDDAPTQVFAARTPETSQTAPPPEPVSEREIAAVAVPGPEPVLQGEERPPVPGSSTLIMDHAELLRGADRHDKRNSGQTLVMTRDQLLSRAPNSAMAADAAGVDTKVMSMDGVVGRAARTAEPAADVPTPELTGDDSGPHTKMMPIEALMKRANAQQRWPLPGIAMQAELRDPEQRGRIKRSFGQRLGDAWGRTSLVRKASLLLMPFLCAMVIARYSKLVVPKAPRARTAVTATSAARPRALPLASSDPASVASAALPVSEPFAPGNAATALPAAPGSGAPAPVASASALPPGSGQGAPAASARADSVPQGRGSGSNAATLQRKAADAVAEGDYAAAVERYRSLAREEPGVPAYAEAARILEERANGARR